MSEISRKLTLAQISKDVHRVAKTCDERAREDETYHDEVKRSIQEIIETLGRIEERTHKIEDKLDPDHDSYILKETNEQLALLMALYKGIDFSAKAIKYTAGVVAAGAIIVGSIFSLIRYVK